MPAVGSDDDEVLTVDARRDDVDGALDVIVAGELDLESSRGFVATATSLVEERPGDVRVVLDGVTFIDSSGVMALLGLRDVVAAGGHRFALVSPSRAVRLVLDLAGLRDQFEIEDPG